MKRKLFGKRIIVTGCGYTKLQTMFTNLADGLPSHDEILISGTSHKMNMGAATAKILAQEGAVVHMVSRTQDKLEIIKDHIVQAGVPNSRVEFSAVDLMDEATVEQWVADLPKNLPLYWFHCVGQSAGSYKTDISNRWLPFDQLTLEHFSTEVIPFWATTRNVAKSLWPIFVAQRETRIVLISSMSAVRCYTLGASHCAAEAAMDKLANVLMLAGYKQNIFVTTLRAGAIDTGTYESKEVQESVIKITNEYNGRWCDEPITLASPKAIGELATAAFSASAHITSINVVSQGQFPNEGS
ncbi:MAG: SDR family oxidoreductase [bacterium]|nr:SDR family oxidoreductase [bacterium]